MTQYRNISDRTVREYVTGRVVEPDAVVEIPAAADRLYVGHPIFREVGAPAPATPPTPPAPPATPAGIPHIPTIEALKALKAHEEQS